MATPQEITFTKMQGTGNDFLVLDNRTVQFSTNELSSFAADWCPRRYGVGADGLLALDSPKGKKADYRMHYVNADGSRATMCANGARCLFRFARQSGFEKNELTFETDAGLYRATRLEESPSRVRLFVPEITDVRTDVALEGPRPEGLDPLYYVHAGTEHMVVRVDDVEAVPVQEWGPRLRYDAALKPAGANVNFVAFDGEGAVSLRTYEKGVEAETLSCGTGVLAAAVMAERTRGGPEEGPIDVHTRGGDLQVGVVETERGLERYLEGPAVWVFEGTVEWDPST